MSAYLFSQSGIPSIHDNLESLINELKQIDATGIPGDKFNLEILNEADLKDPKSYLNFIVKPGLEKMKNGTLDFGFTMPNSKAIKIMKG
jgi:hypothetical protein